jgi:hypothetical protein
MRPPTSTRSRGVTSAATAGAAASGAASVAASTAASRAWPSGQPEREPAAGGGAGGKALTPSEAGGSGRRRHLLEPLAVRGKCVPLQGLGGLSLQLAGKVMAQGCLNAVAPGQLVHIVDQLMGRHFLIDTGAIYSIFPLPSTRR